MREATARVVSTWWGISDLFLNPRGLGGSADEGGRTHDHRIRIPGSQPLRHLALS